MFWLAFSLPFMGDEVGPTSDPDDVVAVNFILLFSALFLLAATAVSRRWKTAWVISGAFVVLLVIVWTQVPSLIEHWNYKGPRRF